MPAMISLYITLWFVFLRIGAISYGGGYVIITYILDILEQHQWINADEFGNLIALSNITPGPIAVNAATYVGYRVAGIGGSFFATFGMFLPSFIFTSIIAKFSHKLSDNGYFISFMSALKPATTAFIASAAIVFIQSLFFVALNINSILYRFDFLVSISKYVNPISIFIAAVSFILLKMKVNVLILLFISGILGLLLF